MEFLTPMRSLRDSMIAEGIPATLRRSTLNPPGVLLVLDQLDEWTIAGLAGSPISGFGRVRMYVCAGGVDEEDALGILQPLMVQVAEFLDARGMEVTEPITAEVVPFGDSGTNLPAFKITTTINL